VISPDVTDIRELFVMQNIAKKCRASAVIVGIFATVTAFSAPMASAAPSLGRSIGSCSSEGYTANYAVTYTSTDQYNEIAKITWQIDGPADHDGNPGVGSHNNVEARVKYDNSLGHDAIYYTWISDDNVPAGSRSVDLGGQQIRIPTSRKMYVEFKFTFDRPDAGDPSCKGHTRNV
jgi:hypothetical protein